MLGLSLFSPTPSRHFKYATKVFLSNLGTLVTTTTELRAGRQGFDSRREQRIVLITTASRQIWGPPSAFSNELGGGALSPDVNRLGRKTDHSPPFTGKVKNAWSYISTPPYIFIA
jgi:hypothetical protein